MSFLMMILLPNDAEMGSRARDQLRFNADRYCRQKYVLTDASTARDGSDARGRFTARRHMPKTCR